MRTIKGHNKAFKNEQNSFRIVSFKMPRLWQNITLIKREIKWPDISYNNERKTNIASNNNNNNNHWIANSQIEDRRECGGG